MGGSRHHRDYSDRLPRVSADIPRAVSGCCKDEYERSAAVIKNVNGSTADDYLADAVTDDLTTELSRLRRAWVIASGTAFTYKDKPNDPRQIGRELNVRYALQGNVRRTGPLVQVNAHLIDTESGTNLWANSYTYETSSLTDLQDKMLGRIATSLRDEVTKVSVRPEVGTLAGDHNPLTGDVLNGWNGAGPAEVDRERGGLHRDGSSGRGREVKNCASGACDLRMSESGQKRRRPAVR
jgi:TolB-like protein